MRWMKSVFGAGKAAARNAQRGAPTASRVDALVRAGYDRESEGDVAGAERFYRQAAELDPAHAEAHYFLARIAAWDRRFGEAISLYQTVTESNPGEATYLFELGNALRAAGRFEESLAAFRACLALLPESVPARINHAVGLIELDRREEARIDLERLRDLMPNMMEAHFNLAGIYREYARIADSIAAYRKIRVLRPDDAPTYSNLLMMLHYSAEHRAAEIFEEHRGYGETFARRYIAPPGDPAWPRRLRIGYVSPDFRSHVVMYFFEPILASHDRSRFEVFCYHTSSESDVVTERLRSHAEHWVDCEYLSHEALAERIRADRIDILVDLAGHTAGNSLAMFAMKPAPVQASYLGYPNTTGLGAVDYRISDGYADPPGESDRLHAESVVRLPTSYFCYRPSTSAPEVGPLPAADAGVITFGCFNNFHKMSEPFLDAVARVLARVPDSRFLLKGRPLSIPEIAARVRGRFERAGIAAGRIELRGWEKGFTDHLAIYRSVDIALDSFPYNGATTTCEALWMGVPVVTVAGDRHAGRTGVSLLNAVGLGTLVATDVDEYVAICARLAADRAGLEELRRTLRDRMRRSPLMDEQGFTRSLERSYLDMWQAHSERAGASRSALDGDIAPLLERARALRESGRLSEADAACMELLDREPGQLEALTLLWDLAFDAGRPGMAIDRLQAAIVADGTVAAVHYMLGCVLQTQGKISDAAAAFRRALELDPAMARAHNNLGCLFEAAGVLQEAVVCYRNAIGADPGLVRARYNLGNACRQLGDLAQATEQIGRAVELEPGHADWHCNLGDLHLERGQLDESIASHRAALEIDPRSQTAHAGLAVALASVGRVEEALAALTRSLELKPDDAGVESWRLWLRHHLHGEKAGALLSMHVDWGRRHTREVVRTTAHPRRKLAADRRLNVGYLLPDPRWCSVAPLVEPLLAAHDESSVAATCYVSHSGSGEDYRRLRDACPQWRDLSAMNDHDAALRIRADAIDVLVDLAGHGPGGRPLVIARGPAAVQAGWLGYPGSMGLDAMEFRLTDAIADPVGKTEGSHVEKLVRLSRPFLCYAPPPDSPAPGLSPLHGAGRVTFGCFADLSKVTAEMMAIWAEILCALPDSRLLLRNDALSADSARRSVAAVFKDKGVADGRVLLGVSAATPLGRLEDYRSVDIAFDTFPYHGTLTTCEALWMGVPVVALAGEEHRARVGASILAAAGLADLVAQDAAGYVRLALGLAADAARLRNLREGLRGKLKASPLLDAGGFAKSMETAYRQMLSAVSRAQRQNEVPANE